MEGLFAMRRPTLCCVVLLAVTATLAVVAPASATPTRLLTMTVVGAPRTIVSGSSQFATGGTTVRIAVARLSGGNVVVTSGPSSTLPSAVQFPPYVASGVYPRAIVEVTPLSGSGLSPGSSDFRYGAVFRLDRISSGRVVDDGDNVFQRGLSSEPSMFKLEVDHGRPSCKVRGSAGAVIVRSGLVVQSGTWYKAWCSRVGSTLSVEVKVYRSASLPYRTVASGSAGTISFPSGRPATIGGKASAVGTMVEAASDQLNGAVAQLWTTRL
jgi:hypothetical protein